MTGGGSARPLARRSAAALTVLALGAVTAGCGTTRQAALPAPPIPVDLSVYVDARSVSVSPTVLGAGPVRLLIASQAPHALLLQVVRGGPSPVGAGHPLIAQSGPIAAGGNRQLSLNLRPGVYTLRTQGLHLTQAALALGSTIAPARLLVGAPRPSSDNALLQP